MWSEHIPVQVVVWRLLFKLKKEGWPQDLLDMMYIEDTTLEIAKSHLGTSFNIMKSIGFLNWKAKQ